VTTGNHVRHISYDISSIHKGRPGLRRIQKWSHAVEKVSLHICSLNFGDEKMKHAMKLIWEAHDWAALVSCMVYKKHQVQKLCKTTFRYWSILPKFEIFNTREHGFSHTKGCAVLHDLWGTLWFHPLQWTICDIYCAMYYTKSQFDINCYFIHCNVQYVMFIVP
jgi:hypothetical protein